MFKKFNKYCQKNGMMGRTQTIKRIDSLRKPSSQLYSLFSAFACFYFTIKKVFVKLKMPV